MATKKKTKVVVPEVVVPDLNLSIISNEMEKKINEEAAKLVPEKTGERKWIEYIAKQVGLAQDVMDKSDAIILSKVSYLIDGIVADSKEYKELKSAFKTINRFNYDNMEIPPFPMLGMSYFGRR